MFNIRYKAKRICLVIGMACNVKCKYCIRLDGKIREPKGFSDLCKYYLQTLNPADTEAIVINGGEPLLYMDRIKEVFSLVPKEIHKVVMSNGTLLTQEIVDFLNENDCEFHFSHEGVGAKYLKGIDILEDPKIVDLLNQLRTVRLYNIVTSCNADLLANYEYVKGKLNRIKHLQFTPFQLFAFPEVEYLIKDFPFSTFMRSQVELREKYPQVSQRSPYRDSYNRNIGVLLLPDGSLASIATLKKYGTVENSKEEILKAVQQSGDADYCLKANCPIREDCVMAFQMACPFTCKAQRMQVKAINFFRSKTGFRV